MQDEFRSGTQLSGISKPYISQSLHSPFDMSFQGITIPA